MVTKFISVTMILTVRGIDADLLMEKSLRIMEKVFSQGSVNVLTMIVYMIIAS